ncbi:MAG: N-acetylmuramoyl-L-alanine amidase [Xanthomonadales bacterium]|nr:N-acetylmuramoyl-L-alanine amidase [Xanthomonadales bacterium]
MADLCILSRPLSYTAKLESRTPVDISLVVIHCTELPDLVMARQYAEQIHYPTSGTGNSGHFYIDRDGSIEQWVEPLQVAHHVADMNQNSIGIELVNRGRYPHWFNSNHQQAEEKYPQEQISSLITLLDKLTNEFPNLKAVAGHQDFDTRMIAAADKPEILVPRKIDPGPQFPWDVVLAKVQLQRSGQQ